MTGLAPIPSADATAASPHFGQVGGARRGGTLLHSVSRYFHATMRCFGVDFGADAPAMGGGAAAGGGAATPLQLVEALGAFRDQARDLVRSRMEINDACTPPTHRPCLAGAPRCHRWQGKP